MKIDLSKFGDILVSRPAGREAFLALDAFHLSGLSPGEPLEIDFAGVKVLTPSWADEVITPLSRRCPSLSFLHTSNPTVQATLNTLRTYSNLPQGLNY